MPNLLLVIFEVAWMNYIQAKKASEIEWALLEIKVPPTIEKGPQIFEHILNGLFATHGGAIDTKYDIYLKGIVETYFSLEIAGIDGAVHFYIYTPRGPFKDLAEAQVYAQYPAAEINEASDYAAAGPRHFPDKHWDIWGTEMILNKEDAYPIRTYNDFQEKMTNLFIDPIASFIEEMSKNLPGEQTWFQILIRPASGDYWKKDAEALIGKLIGRKEKKTFGVFGEFKDFFMDIFSHLGTAMMRPPEFKKKETETDNIKESLMLYLSPDQKEVVEAIGRNITKIGFETTIRWIYMGRKPSAFNKGKGFFSVMAPLRQFESQLLNSFAINKDTKTSAYYIATEFRKNIIKNILMSNYKKRKIKERGFVLNTEELATVYHFPTFEVKAPQAPWVKARRSEAPRELPIG